MTDNYYKISFTAPDTTTKDISIALLSEIGFEGFEEDRLNVHAFIPMELLDESILANLLQQQNINYTKSIIENKNWNAEWESNFNPVCIGNFCQVRAGFHAADPTMAHDIIINPKMSFGTGHHATTWLMIDAMSELNITGTDVFDFGTGTGVLAILAAKMKAASIKAIDNDDWSIENAAENFLLNNVNTVILEKASAMMANSQYSLILANINRHIILANLAAIQQHLKPEGVVLFSGLLKADEEMVTDAAIAVGLQILTVKERQNWICMKMVNKQP
ncbi:MAG: hypothetical protein RLZZ316_2490 [Bacteroidota bacterium]|jgi:ribosomal protein L11 methyltransferase